MRKLLVTLIALGFSGVAMAGIGTSGAAHNFSDGVCWNYTTDAAADCTATETWNTSGELCKVCHAPHEKTAGLYDNAQLWNHTVSGVDYEMYNEVSVVGSASGPFGTIDAAESTNAGSTTRLCLSCHDGTTAIDSFGGHAGNSVTLTTATYYDGLVTKGTNLTTSHPVSINYQVGGVRADSDLNVITTDFGATGVAVEDVLEQAVTGTYTVECSSCHEPHQDRGGNDYLLVVPNTNSQLCLGCHNK